MFKALVLTEENAEIKDLDLSDLPEGDVLVKVAYSSLNYKDGLAVTGKGKVIRNFPCVPGIDLVGEVAESDSPDYQVGDWVIITGWEIGEKYWGGFSQMMRVKSEWLVPLPDGLTPQHAMGIGTAGFTAMQSVMALQDNHVTPDSGEILVTGASGGAGSIAVAILGKLGYQVVASTGRMELTDYLKSLGAAEVVNRAEFSSQPKAPMLRTRWAGAVDAVGGDTLAHIIATTHYGGSIAAYGLAGGSDLNTTVFPFILRGVKLLGINSVLVPKAERLQVWARLVEDLPSDTLDMIMEIAPLSDIFDLGEKIIAGDIRGRIVIDVNG